MSDRDNTCLPELVIDPYEEWLKKDIAEFEAFYGIKL